MNHKHNAKNLAKRQADYDNRVTGGSKKGQKVMPLDTGAFHRPGSNKK